MKFGTLIRYSLYLFIMILITFLILTTYIYFFAKTSTIEIAFSFMIPICMFIVSLLYGRSVHERGLLRGIEIWLFYIAVVLILKVLLKSIGDFDIVQNLIYLPISIVGSIIGVNLKK